MFLQWMQNAFKKHGSIGSSSGAEHVVYANPAPPQPMPPPQGPHGYYEHGYQRSMIESPMDWMFTEPPTTTFSPSLSPTLD